MLRTSSRRGICFVISAPSGAGKTTLTRALLASDDRLSLSVSVTTRAPRPGEVEGEHYYFVEAARFAAMVDDGQLLEHATVFGRGYGTPRAQVESVLATGRDMVFDIDWQGWRQVKAALPARAKGIFLLPPSLHVLRRRLERRAGDDAAEIDRRMAQACEEISHWREFDHVLVNDDLAECLGALRSVVAAARSETARQGDLSPD